MYKLAFITLIFGTLGLAACNNSLQSHAHQAPVPNKEQFYGEVWILPGKRTLHRLGGTLYLNEASSREVPTNAMSSFTLQRMYGSPVNKQTSGYKKIYYISQ